MFCFILWCTFKQRRNHYWYEIVKGNLILLDFRICPYALCRWNLCKVIFRPLVFWFTTTLCESLLEIYSPVRENILFWQPPEGISLDFSEDCFSLPPSGQIDHHTARAMHNAMGVQGADGSVIINGVASGWWPVTRGLPQASVLGPLLFNVVLTDLHVGLEGIESVYAWH